MGKSQIHSITLLIVCPLVILTIQTNLAFAALMFGEVEGYFQYTDGTKLAEYSSGDTIRYPSQIGSVNEVRSDDSYSLNGVDRNNSDLGGSLFIESQAKVDKYGLHSRAASALTGGGILSAPEGELFAGHSWASSAYIFDFYSNSAQTVEFDFLATGFTSLMSPSDADRTSFKSTYLVGLYSLEESANTGWDILEEDTYRERSEYTEASSSGVSNVSNPLSLSIDVAEGWNLLGFNLLAEVHVSGHYTNAYTFVSDFDHTLTITDILSDYGGIYIDADNLYVDLFGSFDQVGVLPNPNNPVPVPTTMLLLGTGLVGLAGARLRRKK